MKLKDQLEFIRAAAGEERPNIEAIVAKYMNLKLATRPKEQNMDDVDTKNRESRIVQGNFDVQSIHDLVY